MNSLSMVSNNNSPSNIMEKFNVSSFYAHPDSAADKILEQVQACLNFIESSYQHLEASRVEYFNYIKFHWRVAERLLDDNETTATKIQKICFKLIYEGIVNKFIDKEIFIKFQDTQEPPIHLNVYHTTLLYVASPMICDAFNYEFKESLGNLLSLDMSKEMFIKIIDRVKNPDSNLVESIDNILEIYENVNMLRMDGLKKEIVKYILLNAYRIDFKNVKSIYNYFASHVTEDSKKICESLYIFLAEHYISHSKLTKAQALLEFALKTNPEPSTIIYVQACINAKQRNFIVALQMINAAIQQNSNISLYFIQRAHLNFVLAKNTEAIKDLDYVLFLEPDNCKALIKRGDIWLQMRHYYKAKIDFTIALRIEPANSLVLSGLGMSYTGRSDGKELENYNKALKIDPHNSIAWRRRGEYYRKEARYEEALADFNAALRLDPEDADALEGRVYIYSLQNKFEEAMKDYQALLQIKPDEVQILLARGKFQQQHGKMDEALLDFNAVLQLAPDYIEAVKARGELFRKQGKWREALKDFDEVLQNTNDEFTWGRRGDVYLRLHNYEEALKDFSAALNIHKHSIFSLRKRGDLYRRQDKFREALKDFNVALEVKSNCASILRGRGDVFLKQGKLPEALIDFDKALKLKPNNVFSLSRRGDIYRRQGKYREALKDFDEVLKREPKNVFALKGRGEVYRLLGRPEEALKDINEVLQLEPRCASVLGKRSWIEMQQGHFRSALKDFYTILQEGVNNEFIV